MVLENIFANIIFNSELGGDLQNNSVLTLNKAIRFHFQENLSNNYYTCTYTHVITHILSQKINLHQL